MKVTRPVSWLALSGLRSSSEEQVELSLRRVRPLWPAPSISSFLLTWRKEDMFDWQHVMYAATTGQHRTMCLDSSLVGPAVSSVYLTASIVAQSVVHGGL